MKLTTGDAKAPIEENECGVLRNSDSTTKVKWKSNPAAGPDCNEKQPVEDEVLEDNSIMSAYEQGGGVKVILRKKEDMEKTAATMDAIIQGVSKCRIQNKDESRHNVCGKQDKDAEENDLTGKLSKLSIETKQTTGKYKEPKEDDERGSNRSSESDEDETNSQPPQVRLVKLEPPMPSKETTDTKDSEEVITRGPAGIPVYQRNRVNNNFSGKQFAQQQQQQMPLMPDNFPNYQQMYANSNNNSNAMGHLNGSAVPMGKRCMEPQEMYPEAPKYVRPQQMQNNLDAPGMPLPANGNTNMPLSPTSFRPHSTVCVNQMAGGTLFAAEEQENLAMCQLQQQQMPGWGGRERQSHSSYPQQDPNCYPGSNNDFLEEAVNDEEEGRVDSEEIERLLLNAVAVNQLKNDTVIDRDVENLLFPKNSSPQMVSLPMPTRPAGALDNHQGGNYMWNYSQQGERTHDFQTTFLDKQQQQQQQQQQQLFNYCPPNNNNNHHYGNPLKNPSPHRNSSEDMGYATDQSPSHESSQFSPCPSSIMTASPAASNMSGSPPHQHNWSPPPSNMSQDSGVASPMSETQYGQLKSPRSVGSMSDMASPPHPSSVNNMAAAPVFRPQPHQSPNSFDFGIQSKDVVDLGILSQDIISPVDFGKLDFDVDPNYKDPFIDANLPELALALQVADKDVGKDLSKLSSGNRSQAQQQQIIRQQQWHQQQQPQITRKELGTPVVQPTLIPCTIMNVTSPPGQTTPTMQQQGRGMIPQQQQQQSVILTSGNHGMADANLGPKPTVVADMTNLNNRILSNAPVTTIISSAPSTFTFTTAPVAPMPMINKEGKVQIPPNTPKVQPMSNVMLSTVIVMPQQKPRFQPIAPKDPTKQNGPAAVNGNDNSGSVTNVAASTSRAPPSGNRSQGTGSTPAATATKTSPEMILNQARRFVADYARADLQNKDEEGDAILHLAMCKTDGPYLIKALLERLEREGLMSLIDSQNNNGQTPLYLAVGTNDTAKVKVLVDQGADVTIYADHNGTKEKKAAIHCASSNGHTYLQTLKILLSAPGIDVEQRDSQGYTALHCAILNHGKTTVIHKKKKSETVEINSIPIVEALVAAGASPNLAVQNGRTALMIALETRYLDLFEKLLSLVNPADKEKCLKTPDFKGNSVLKIAERLKGSLQAADQLRLQNCLKRTSFQRNSGSGN